MLVRGEDYEFVAGQGYFDLSRIAVAATDTLIVSYRPLPSWLVASYGRELPSPQPKETPNPLQAPVEVMRPPRGQASQVTLSGAKTFRFSARSAGSSEFGQSLDLHISGELSPGLEIMGTVSDRGYEPAYGTANSRLSELDKINLQLTSPSLFAQVGDIVVDRNAASSRSGKSVSGASFQLAYPRWHVNGTAARPRGRFSSVNLTGRDGFQGPYQVTQGAAGPIVPGSETVWLDGNRVERGANKDYTIDYPTGRITFTVMRPIDSRSRIEVDFEPLSTEYKQELFAGGGGISLGDSAFYVSTSVIREGDDRNQLLAGELSDSDKALLAAAGDGPATRSGVSQDTAGAYALVTDSLPDSVYQYVGVGNGDLSVHFSYVGAGNGAYQFLGGEQYTFVGAGNGDYLPVIILPAATRTDYVDMVMGSESDVAGRVSLDLRSSSRDRNLWSPINDNDNEATFLDARWKRPLASQDSLSFIRARFRRRESGFVSRERVDIPDFARRFYFPTVAGFSNDETFGEVETAVKPLAGVNVQAIAQVLRYTRQYDAKAGEASVTLRPYDRLDVAAHWRSVRSTLDSVDVAGAGLADNVLATARYRPGRQWELAVTGEHDRRRNTYTSNAKGTKFNRARAEVIRGDTLGYGERVDFERYVEDTLVGRWREALTRNRLGVASSRRFGEFTYDGQVTYQWLARPDGDESNFLSRAGLNYQSPRHKLSANASYVVSDERRNARGITYLEVEQGLGNYLLENGQYVPDPDGNYIQVEEILSDVARVRRGEKSFYVNKDWSVVSVRLSSNIEEELQPGGKRSALWVLPFYSDATQPYLFFSRQYRGDVRAIQVRGFHAVNLQVSDEIERRDIASVARQRHDTKSDITLKQVVSETYFEQAVELFSYKRDNYYSGAGDISGYRASVTGRQVLAWGEVSLGGAYRRADDKSDASSEIWSALSGARWRAFDHGELRASFEGYFQTFRGDAASASYQLTGNRPGDRGVVWSVSLNYGVKGGVRVNVSIDGRHSNDRTARITGRGEVVAGF